MHAPVHARHSAWLLITSPCPALPGGFCHKRRNAMSFDHNLRSHDICRTRAVCPFKEVHPTEQGGEFSSNVPY